DVVDQTPGDGSCDPGGTVGSDAECTLRAAIQESNSLAGTQTIVIPAGTYSRTIGGTGEDASATGDFDINDDVTISGAGSGLVTIDAEAIDRIFEIRSGSTLNLSGVTVTDGAAPSNTGGAFYVSSGTTVNLDDVTVHDNDGPLGGGALYVLGTAVVTDSTISANTSSSNGGAIQAAGSVTLTRVTVSGNSTTGGHGGAVNSSGPLVITDSLIEGNTASGNGGGIRVVGSSGSANLTNVTMSGNDATGSGGAIDNGDTVVLVNSTITNNTAGSVGGINDNATISLLNTIVAANTGGSNPDVAGTFTSLGYNIIGEDGTSSGWFISTDQLDTDPLLSALADNGGPTQTHAIGLSSPALDAGTAGGAPDADQRGTARPIDGDGDTTAADDIGAFEYDPATDAGGGGGAATNLLMVTNGGGFGSGNDTAKKALFESWGWTVTGFDGASTSGEYATAAAANDVLFFSDTANGTSAIVAGLDIGVVTEIYAGWRNTLYASTDEMGWGNNTTVDIVDNSHYITSPFSTGSLTVHTSADDVNYWNSGASALPAGVTVLAESPTSASHDSLLVAETGGTLYSANTAPNRRVWFPSDAANPSVFTASYETLLERSLDWAAGNDVVLPAAGPTVTVNSTGDSGDNNIGDDLCYTGSL
ncbi:MAG: right-handed parallel beta-helix repeat-containing protein, partial [Actinomycetota bacterium]